MFIEIFGVISENKRANPSDSRDVHLNPKLDECLRKIRITRRLAIPYNPGLNFIDGRKERKNKNSFECCKI